MDLAANAAHERHQLRKARDEHMFSGMPPIAARKRAVPALTFSAKSRRSHFQKSSGLFASIFAEGPWGRKYPAIAQSWRRHWSEELRIR